MFSVMQIITLTHYPGSEIRLRAQREQPPRNREGPESSENVCVRPSYDSESVEGKRLLTLSEASYSEPRSRSGFGSLGRFTRFSRRSANHVRRLGNVLESEYPRERTLFITGTLPGSTGDAFRAIAEWSSFIVDRLKSWLSKRCAPGSRSDLFVWEWQKRGALHLHWVCGFGASDDMESVLAGFHDWWCSILELVSEKSGVDLFDRGERGGTWRDSWSMVRADATVVRKSVGRYLSKYLSKCSSPNRYQSSRLGGQFNFCPTRWWGTSRNLADLLKSKTEKIEFFASSETVAASKFDVVRGLLELISEKSIEYRDRVGSGLNALFLGMKDDSPVLTIVKNLMKRRFDVMNEQKSMSLRIAELFQGIMFCLDGDDVMLGSRISTHASGAYKAAKNYLASGPIGDPDRELIELHTILNEISAFANDRFYSADLHRLTNLGWKMVAARASHEIISAASAQLSGQILDSLPPDEEVTETVTEFCSEAFHQLSLDLQFTNLALMESRYP